MNEGTVTILLSIYVFVALVVACFYFLTALSDPNAEAFTAAFWAALTGAAWPVVVLYGVLGGFRK